MDSARRIVGRAAQGNPANRFESVVLELDEDGHTSASDVRTVVKTQYLPDDTQSIVSENNSPDLNFRYSLNPYRGCEHGCSYCYARTYHEFLGMSGGLDFETKILYKPHADKLFRTWLNRRKEPCEPVSFSGGTDCYQPAEKEFQLTRRCLSVALACHQPVTIVTKNSLVLRDMDILTKLAEADLVHVNISLTSLDQQLIRNMEPRTSAPSARLEAIKTLVNHHVPTRALLSPIIPGLNDHEIPRLVEAVASVGGHAVSSTVLRLPGVVQDVFLDWLRSTLPSKSARIESRIRQIRDGELHDPRFGRRLSGTGELAKQIRQTFQVFARKHHLGHELPPLRTTDFCKPGDLQQRRLF